MAGAPATHWWQNFFDETFGALLLDRDNDSALPATATFLMDKLNLQQGHRVFDQCCGTGALSLAFAAKGVQVHGVDLMESYINRAQEKSKQKGLSHLTAFKAADAFNYVAPQCDAAVNWYSSFGYHRDDRKNVKMFERLFDSVKPGGMAAVEYMNLHEVVANFRPVFTRTAKLNGQDVEIEKETTLDYRARMIASTWTYRLPDGQEKKQSGESRLYLADDIKILMLDAGFTDLKFYGGTDGGPLEKLSPRVICTGLKAGR